MDYKAFFADVLGWIGQANQAAVTHGMDSDQFWEQVTQSANEICVKYDNHRLALKQMSMMVEWLDEVFQERISGEGVKSA